MLLQDFCTVLLTDSMKLLTPQRDSVDITRHGTLLYLTSEIVPYHNNWVNIWAHWTLTCLKFQNFPLELMLWNKWRHWLMLWGQHTITPVSNCAHKRPRRALFTPERSDCPVPIERLNGQRTTYLDYGAGNVREVQDNFITAGLPNMLMGTHTGKERLCFNWRLCPLVDITPRRHLRALLCL